MPSDADPAEDPGSALYGLPPEQFTAVRDERARAARAAGDRDLAKALAALRRPTVSAYAVNALVRDDAGLLDQLSALGAALGEAQRAGRGADLKALGVQRRDLVEEVADRAASVAGRELTAAVRAEVTATLEAALADPASAEAVRSGRLVRALSFAGFGGVDLEGAVADVPRRIAGSDEPAGGGPGQRREGPAGAEPRKRRRSAQVAADAKAGRATDDAADAKEQRRAALAAAEARSQQAHGALDDAVRGHDAARETAAESERVREAAAAELATAERAWELARRHQGEAEGAVEEAERELERRQQEVQDAQAEAERVRADLDRLRRPG